MPAINIDCRELPIVESWVIHPVDWGAVAQQLVERDRCVPLITVTQASYTSE